MINTTVLLRDRQNGRSPADLRATDFLHLYIYDYCKKRNFQQTARTFAAEAGLQADQVPPIDIPSGFLSDWWGVFWDVYNARHNDVNASKEAVAYDQVHRISTVSHPEFTYL